jgi:XRE family transcriptional regulator, regulator of sulfur utilization
MIVRKLRLQRGWTQEHLAELTALSVRSIQRLERGQTGSLESVNALAAVFEVDRSLFKPGDNPMLGAQLGEKAGRKAPGTPALSNENI